MAYRNYSTAVSHIVDATGQGDFSDLPAAMAAADPGETIFLRDGTYSGTTITPGVNICAFPCSAQTGNVTINGKLIMTSAGDTVISGVRLQTNGDYFLSISGASKCKVYLQECYFSILNNTGIQFSSTNASSYIGIANCQGDIGATGIAIFSATSPGTIGLFGGFYNNSGSSITPSTINSTTVSFYNTNLGSNFQTSTTGNINVYNSVIDTSNIAKPCIITSGTGANLAYNTYFASSTASALSIGSGTNVVMASDVVDSSNTNAIAGSGTLSAGVIVFVGSSTIQGTLTVNHLTVGP